MTDECKKEEKKDEVIALRKSAGSGDSSENVFGTGLSHYILMDREDD